MTQTNTEQEATTRMELALIKATEALKLSHDSGFGSEVLGPLQQAIDALRYAHRMVTVG